MPDIRETEELQRIEIEEKWQTGINGLSEASLTTLDKITETVLLALLATTVGTILSIPISFIAARNLMVTLGSPLAQAINLLQYRQASVIMIAIAIVVGLLGYISSRVRARIL